MQLIRNKLISLLNKTGYDIIEASSPDQMSFPVDDASKILRFVKSGKLPYLCYVPIHLVRGHVMSFKMDPVNHPFAVAARKAKRSNRKNRRLLIREVLDHYYKSVQPDCAAEVLGVEGRHAPPLNRGTPWIVVHPWEDRSLSDLKRDRPKYTRQDNLRVGKNMGIEEGWHLFGPVSENKLEAETRRLERLMRKVEKGGFKVRNSERDNITAMVLINEKEECRWIVYNGQHRIAVLTAFDYRKAPVLINKVVERKDVKVWPGVQRGYFTQEGALKVFDRVFHGKTSPIVDEF